MMLLCFKKYIIILLFLPDVLTSFKKPWHRIRVKSPLTASAGLKFYENGQKMVDFIVGLEKDGQKQFSAAGRNYYIVMILWYWYDVIIMLWCLKKHILLLLLLLWYYDIMILLLYYYVLLKHIMIFWLVWYYDIDIIIMLWGITQLPINRLYSFERKTLALLVFARTCMSARMRKSY